MANAYIAYTKPNGVIKSVRYFGEGSIDELGVCLIEYIKDTSTVKTILQDSIRFMYDGIIEYMDEADEFDISEVSLMIDESECTFEEFDGKDDFINDMNAIDFYYLYENNTWYVSKPNFYDFKELEVVIEEEF